APGRKYRCRVRVSPKRSPPNRPYQRGFRAEPRCSRMQTGFGRPGRGGMSSFDYSAPAELFLAKPTKGSRTKYFRFATAAEALRYAVRTCAYPKPSAHGLGM